MKPIYRSKTFWVNALLVAGAALAGVNDASIIQDPQAVTLLGMAVGFVNIILRYITKDPVK